MPILKLCKCAKLEEVVIDKVRFNLEHKFYNTGKSVVYEYDVPGPLYLKINEDKYEICSDKETLKSSVHLNFHFDKYLQMKRLYCRDCSQYLVEIVNKEGNEFILPYKFEASISIRSQYSCKCFLCEKCVQL